MSRNWSWYRPHCLEDAVGLLIAHGADAVIVAGGTSVGLNPPRRDGIAMIDLQDLDLRSIEQEEDKVRIGAMTTAHDLASSELLDGVGGGMLREAGRRMGPRPVRNRITLGGNLMQPFRWSDLPVAMLALDAELEVFGPKGPRTLAAGEIFSTQPRRHLAPGELLAWVLVPRDGTGRSGCFLKLGWTAVDHAAASAAVRLSLEGGRCADLRVAAGALAPLPQRLTGLEEALVGTSLDDEAIAAAVADVDPVRIVGERRADESYKREVIGPLVARALRTARDRVGGEGKGGGSC